MTRRWAGLGLLSLHLGACHEPRAAEAPSGGPSLELAGPAAREPAVGGELPDFATPKTVAVDLATLDRSDLIRYRALTSADFKAREPELATQEHAEELGALTYAYVTTTDTTLFRIEREGDGPFRGRVIAVEFVARMDRKRSWWNRKTPQNSPYELQHEQIHFALAELAANKQTDRARKKLANLVVTADTQEATEAKLNGALNDLLDDAMAELLDANLRFDQETSAQRDAKAQQAWYDRVERSLSAYRTTP